MDEATIDALIERLQSRAAQQGLTSDIAPLVRALSFTVAALAYADDDADVKGQLQDELAGLLSRAEALLDPIGDEEITAVRGDPFGEVTVVRPPRRPAPRLVPPRRRR